jgi:hypothetical protein
MATAVRAFFAAMLSAFAAYGATGCGTETVGVEQLAQAADTSARTTGVKVGIDATIEGPQGEDAEMTGSGVMDMRGQRGEFTYQIAGQEMRQVMDRFVMYMQSPQLEPALDDGKEWAKLDLEKSSRELGFDLGAVQQPGSSDPRQTFSQLKAVSGEIEKVGTDDVRGVETTHYSADVEIDKLHEAIPPARRAAARRSVQRMKELTGLDDYPLDVWIDDDDLVRRMRFQMDMKVGGQDVGFDMSMDFFDYGTRVRIETPPDEEVQDLTELAAQGATMFGGGGAGP